MPILAALACIAVLCAAVEWTLRRRPEPRRLRLSEPIQDRDLGDETPGKGPRIACPRNKDHDAMMDDRGALYCFSCQLSHGEGYFLPATATFPLDKAA